MTIKETTDLGSMLWVTIATPLGSLTARVYTSEWDQLNIDRKHFRFNGLSVYDACWMVMRPETFWIIENSDLLDPKTIRYTDKEAKTLGYVIEVETEEGGKVIATKVVNLIEVEGEMITDYVPIRPDIDFRETKILIMMNQIIYTHPVDSLNSVTEDGKQFSKQMESYINQVMGRLPVKEVDVPR